MKDIICKCNNVSYKDIENAVKEGAVTYDEVQDMTLCGTACANCEDTVKSIIEELVKTNRRTE